MTELYQMHEEMSTSVEDTKIHRNAHIEVSERFAKGGKPLKDLFENLITFSDKNPEST